MTKLQLLLKSKNKVKDIKAYITGTYRSIIWNILPYLDWESKFFMRTHIEDQIFYRITFWMDKECSGIGICKICGCSTPALQMANKSCDKPCYPEMMNKKEWNSFINGNTFKGKDGLWTLNKDLTLTFKKYTHVSEDRRGFGDNWS